MNAPLPMPAALSPTVPPAGILSSVASICQTRSRRPTDRVDAFDGVGRCTG